LNEVIAEISLDPKKKKIIDIIFKKNNFRFKCKRCAVFCCKLGGAAITEKDLKQLIQHGHEVKDLLEKFEKGTKIHSVNEVIGFLKMKGDGSCVFLYYDKKNKIYGCNIYDQRPIFCRFFPFEIENKGLKTSILKFIPCCNGLNASKGQFLDKNFFEENLLEAMLDYIGFN
jgi:Fe-S-cluster containining protein